MAWRNQFLQLLQLQFLHLFLGDAPIPGEFHITYTTQLIMDEEAQFHAQLPLQDREDQL